MLRFTELSGGTGKRRQRKRMEQDVAELNPEAQSRGSEGPQGEGSAYGVQSGKAR